MLGPGPRASQRVDSPVLPTRDTWTHTHSKPLGEASQAFWPRAAPPPSSLAQVHAGAASPGPWGWAEPSTMGCCAWDHPGGIRWRHLGGGVRGRTEQDSKMKVPPEHGRPRQSSHVYLENGVR